MCGGKGLRRRKPADAASETPAEPTPAPKRKPDPVRLFHTLPPFALRTAASVFNLIPPSICALVTTLHKLNRLASQISHRRVKSVHKILVSPPSWPPEESQLDRESGFGHLCTAEQTVGVLARFMSGAERVWVLKLGYAGIAGETRWGGAEDALGEAFPHLYGMLEGAMVERGERWEGVDLEHVEWK